jgi:hypothetical protein
MRGSKFQLNHQDTKARRKKIDWPVVSMLICAVKILLPCLCLFAFLCGCATTNYLPYTGEQQDWPISPGTFTSTYDGVTIYHGLPPKPYDVLGKVVVEDSSDRSLCWQAKSHSADAVIIVDSKIISGGSVHIPGSSTTYGSGMISGNNFYGSASTYSSPSFNIPVEHNIRVAWLVKFKSETEVKLERLRDLNEFLTWAEENKNGSVAIPATNGQPAVRAYSAEEIAAARARREAERNVILAQLPTNTIP